MAGIWLGKSQSWTDLCSFLFYLDKNSSLAEVTPLSLLLGALHHEANSKL